jgi:tetratricopeptide (TPR) repeat protein
MNIRILFLVILFFSSANGFGQSISKFDSLLNVLKNTKQDTTKVNTLNALSSLYGSVNSDTSLFYVKKGLLLAEKIHYKKGIAKCFYNIASANDDKSNYEIAIVYYQKSLNTYKELADKNGMSNCYNNMGNVRYYQSNYPLALECYQKSLKIAEELGDKKGMSASYNNMGNVFVDQGNYPQALEYYQKSLKMDEELGNKKEMSFSFGNIGNVHLDQGNYPQALEYYEKQLKIDEALEDDKGKANCYNNIGLVYTYVGNCSKALDYYQKQLKISEKLEDKKGLSRSYTNIGLVYKKQGKFNLALEYYQKSLKIYEELGAQEDMSLLYGNIAGLYNSQKKYNEAIIYANKSIEIAKKIGSLDDERLAHKHLSESYQGLENYKSSLEHYILYKLLNDSIYNTEKNNQLSKMEAVYQSEKKQKEIELLNKDKQLQKTEINRQTTQKYAFIFGFILMLTLAFVSFRSYRQKKKANLILAEQKFQIEEKNEELNQQNEEITAQRDEIEAQRDEITNQRDTVTLQKDHIEKIHVELTDSIRYAKRIQQAVLPVSDLSREIMGEHFILFEPRNVVSGDFYWFVKRGNYLIIAVADCTGHGVPGAFMSMLGVSFLNEIVSRSDVTTASGVLNEMRQYVISSLQQQGVSGEQKDGMDMSVVAIDTINLKMQFAGANNPIYIISSVILNDSDELFSCEAKSNLKIDASTSLSMTTRLIELKGDKMPIAIHIKMDDFTNQEMQLQKGDILYMFSDGYADQFGGPKGRKFMYAPLKELLLKISDKPMSEQLEILSENLEKWKNGFNVKYEQIDDVTVLGVKI